MLNLASVNLMQNQPVKLFFSQTNIIFYLSLCCALFSVVCSYFISASVSGDDYFAPRLIGTATVVQFSVMAFAMLIAWRQTTHYSSQHFYFSLLAVGVLARLLLVPVESYTSSDISRYLFDGKLLIEGFDPYRVSHDDNALLPLVAQWQPPQEHMQYVTLYPPFALGLFGLAASFGVDHAAIAWKVMIAISSIMTLLVGHELLKHMGKQKNLPLLALSPLLILEAGVGAHLDTITTLFVCLALWAWMKEKPLLAGVFIALGALLKFLPLVLLLPLLLFYRHIKPAFQLLLGTTITLVVGYGLVFLIGLEPIGSIGVFFQKWRFGSPLFSFLESYLSTTALIFSLAVLFICGLIYVVMRCLSYRGLLRKISSRNVINKSDRLTFKLMTMVFLLALPLLLSPVVFPWYLMPLIPFIVLVPRAWLILWMLLMPFSYEVLNQFLCCGIWQPAQWPLMLIGGGVLLACLCSLYLTFFPTPVFIRKAFSITEDGKVSNTNLAQAKLPI